MKVSSLFSTLLVFLLLSSMAYAAIQVNTYTPSKDFSLTSAFSEVSVCSCSEKYDSITITNTGTWPAIFSISTNEIKSKLTISQNNIELNPGQSQEVFLYITADCSRGNEDLKLTVTSNLGAQKTIEKKIVRDRCQNIEMWANNYTQNMNPCESRTFEINLHNIGPFTDTYTISSNYDEYMTYNAKAVTLEPNQYAKISATAKFDCSIYGLKDIRFTANSEKNKLTASMSVPLNILDNYNFDVKINKESGDAIGVQVCNRVYTTQIPVTITNNGSVTNEYNIKADNLPKYAKIDLEDLKINLSPKQSKTFYINVDSSKFRSEQKSRAFTLEISSALGDVVKESEVVLHLMPCYENQVIINDAQDNSKRNALETCGKYDYSYDVDIVNNGLFTETYKLSLEGAPAGIKLSKTDIQVEAGQKKTVQLFITGPEYNELYNVKVISTASNGLQESDNTWIRSSDSQICHATSMGKSNFRINYQTEKITIPLSNNGMVDNYYIVSWDGSNIVDFDETSINVNNSESQDIVLDIDSSEKKEGTYNGKILVDETSGASYSKDITIKLKDKSGIRKAFEYLAFGNTCKQVSLYQIFAIILLIILAAIFLIRGPHYPYKFWNRVKSKSSIILLLLVIFLVGAILVVTVVGMPKTHDQVYNLTINDSELTYEWLQDDKYVLDVSKFFYDPENNTLKYEVTGLKHIEAASIGTRMTFYPEKGWSGIEHAKITAYDNRGGSVTSPEFTLIVKDTPEKSILELYDIYCWYTNLVIFAIVLLFVFVAVFVKQKKRARK